MISFRKIRGKCNMRKLIKLALLRTDWTIQRIRHNDVCIFQASSISSSPFAVQSFVARRPSGFSSGQIHTDCFLIFLFDRSCQRAHGYRFTNEGNFLVPRLNGLQIRCRILILFLISGFCFRYGIFLFMILQ